MADAEGAAAPVRSGRRGARVWWRLLALSCAPALLVGLWFLLPIRSVTVTGNRHLSAAQALGLAGLTPPFYGVKRLGGWLYYGGWRAAGLRTSPWVASARIVRYFPGRVELNITERVPVARWQQPAGSVVSIAQDGTVLPGAAPTGPLLTGWGPDRLPLARRAAQAFGRYTVESVRYTPSGVVVQTAQGTIWSGTLDSLLKYSGSVKMFAGKRINIYPWGVSVQQ